MKLINISRYTDGGRLVEEWVQTDTYDFLRQLGALRSCPGWLEPVRRAPRPPLWQYLRAFVWPRSASVDSRRSRFTLTSPMLARLSQALARARAVPLAA